jgi:23S rRNA pseudouridine2457 synthase
MVSQFVSSHDVRLLGNLPFDFPEGTHAIGRLDNHSEGLLILSTDKKLTRILFNKLKVHQRSYLVMVKNRVSDESIEQLRKGIVIKTKANVDHYAKPLSVERVENPVGLYRYATDPRESYPHSWLLITLTEGKFHQVRKMVMALGHRCLRLIRLSIDDIQLGGLQPGEVLELDKADFYKLIDVIS